MSSSPFREGFVKAQLDMVPTMSSFLSVEELNPLRKRQCIARVSRSSPFCKQSRRSSLSISIPTTFEKESHNSCPPSYFASGSPSPDWSIGYNSDTSRETLFSPYCLSSSGLSRSLSSHSNNSDSRSCLSTSSFDSSDNTLSLSRKHARTGDSTHSPIRYSDYEEEDILRQHASIPALSMVDSYRQITEPVLRQDKAQASVTTVLSHGMMHLWNLNSPSQSLQPSPPPVPTATRGCQQDKQRAFFSPQRTDDTQASSYRATSFCDDINDEDEAIITGEKDKSIIIKTPQAVTKFSTSHLHHHHVPPGICYSGKDCSLFSPGSNSNFFSPATATATGSAFTSTSIPTSSTAAASRTLSRHVSESTVILTPLPHATPTRQHSTDRSRPSNNNLINNLFFTPQGANNRSSLHTCGGGDDDWGTTEAASGVEVDLFTQLFLNENTSRCPQISTTHATQRGIFRSPTSAFANNNSNNNNTYNNNKE